MKASEAKDISNQVNSEKLAEIRDKEAKKQKENEEGIKEELVKALKGYHENIRSAALKGDRFLSISRGWNNKKLENMVMDALREEGYTVTEGNTQYDDDPLVRGSRSIFW